MAAFVSPLETFIATAFPPLELDESVYGSYLTGVTDEFIISLTTDATDNNWLDISTGDTPASCISQGMNHHLDKHQEQLDEVGEIVDMLVASADVGDADPEVVGNDFLKGVMDAILACVVLQTQERVGARLAADKLVKQEMESELERAKENAEKVDVIKVVDAEQERRKMELMERYGFEGEEGEGEGEGGGGGGGGGGEASKAGKKEGAGGAGGGAGAGAVGTKPSKEERKKALPPGCKPVLSKDEERRITKSHEAGKKQKKEEVSQGNAGMQAHKHV